MLKRTILQNEFVSMWFHPLPKIVHHEFHKFLWGDTLFEALNTGLEVLKAEGACKWLSDDRGSGALSQADTEWCMRDWFPRVLKAGWKCWAVVLPANVIGQMNMSRFMAEYSKQGLQARAFSDPGRAFSWLEKADPKKPSQRVSAPPRGPLKRGRVGA